VETANLLRLLTPDVAEFWTYLYNGTKAAGVYSLVQFLSVILMVIAFGFLVFELALLGDWRAASGKLLRFLIASVLILNSGTLVGREAKNAPLWRIYHNLYSGIYGDNGFYKRWLYGQNANGPIPQSIKSINEALKVLMLKRAAYEAIDSLVINGLLKPLGVSCKALNELPVGRQTLFGPICRASDLAQEAVRKAEAAYERATINLFIALLFLIGAHAAIIYGSVILTYALTFFAPLAAALFLFKTTERALPTLLGYTLAAYLVLALSAVGFGATSVVLFNTLAARIQNALPKDDELRQIKTQMENLRDATTKINATVEMENTRIKANVSILRQLLNSSISCDPSGVCAATVPVQSDVPNYTVYTVTKTQQGTLALDAQPKQCTFSRSDVFTGGTTVDISEVRACIQELEGALAKNRETLDVVPNALEGVISGLADRVTSFVRDVLFTFTILTGAAVVLGAIMSLAMFWLIATVGRLIGGEIRMGQGIGGKPAL
jgi:ABC-type multidrug transport system fused ATPase/permease subunit